MNDIEIRVGSRDQTGPDFQRVEGRFRRLRQVGSAAAKGLGAAGAAAGGLFAMGVADNMNIEVANDKLAAQLGLSTKEAKSAGVVAGKVYASNWGDNIDEVNEAIRSVGNNLGDVTKMSEKELQGVTTKALALSKTFDLDVNESTKAAGQMIKNGLAKDSTEAFDLITAGMQNGLNRSDDFLETLSEYSPQFAKLGIKGPQALGVLSSFLKAGARDTDVAADAFKEFSIRAIDGSETTMDAYKSLGINGKKMGKQIAEGGEGASKGLDQIIKKLQGIKDPQEQNRIGTELFGTQWEDTVRQILPKLDITKGAIEDVEGATDKMADTMGDNAAGKIETLKRRFEQWTQKMAESESQIGLVATGAVQFGGAALGAGGQIGMMALAMRGLNLAFLVSPIGLTIAAVAALAGGMVLLWKKSQTARVVMTTVFAALSHAILSYAGLALRAFKLLVQGFMGMAGQILSAAEKAFGWMPKIGDKVKKAKHAFDGMEKTVTASLDKAIKKTDEWKSSVDKMPKRVVLQGRIDDLNKKINAAKAKLKTVPKSRRAAIRADIGQLQERVRRAKSNLASIQGKTVYITYQGIYKAGKAPGSAGNGLGFAKASGGIIGAATGGARGGLVEVGEYGRELVQLPYGSQVIPKGRSDAMMAQSSGGGTTVIEIRSGGSRLDDLLVEVLRGSIRRKGGNVQTVLGKGRG